MDGRKLNHGRMRFMIMEMVSQKESLSMMTAVKLSMMVTRENLLQIQTLKGLTIM